MAKEEDKVSSPIERLFTYIRMWREEGKKMGEVGGRVAIGVMTWNLNGKDALHPPCYCIQRDVAQDKGCPH